MLLCSKIRSLKLRHRQETAIPVSVVRGTRCPGLGP
ncbi:hypothetical protein T06_2329 [Trichinella sp. T6]|nr:hypothetical protein T06_2329 [Trichinella sp. T6]